MGSALAGNGDVFLAAGTAAVFTGTIGNGPRDFIRIDAPVGRGLGEIPRPAIGQGGMRTAFVALGETLVDPVAVRLIFDDETRLSADAAADAARRNVQAKSADMNRIMHR
jgi:hypothetical protein